MEKTYFNFETSEEEKRILRHFNSFEPCDNGFYLSEDDINGIIDSVVYCGCEDELYCKIYDYVN